MYRRNEPLRPTHLAIDSISFSMFTREQIAKLSVVKICTPMTFDALGHPLPGGIYDAALGPLMEKAGPCSTCRKNFFHCPGHFGHIELPLPVVNPIFHKTLGLILRITCLRCFHIQIPGHVKKCLAIQNKLLNCGLVTDAMEIEYRMMELIATHETFDNIPEHAFKDILKFEVAATEALLNQLDGKAILNKNTETLRNQFINEIMKSVDKKERCIFCKKGMSKIQVLKNKVVLTNKRNQDSDGSVMKKRVRNVESRYITPDESKRYMRNLWENEKDILRLIISVLDEVNAEYPTDIFYYDTILVVPPLVRPVNVIADRISEHPQSQIYKSILQTSILLRAIAQVVQNNGDVDCLPQEAKGAYNFAQGATPIEKLNHTWEALQYDVDGLMDKDIVRNKDGFGLKQLIEKKAGIIRQHMMGKRVNFAARSVITPDPNLNIDEIGVPEAFAKHLTYPVPVTTWNVEKLRKMIMNGPNVHPGATLVEFEDGSIKRINPSDERQQNSILNRLLTKDDKEKGFRGVKMVHRHLCNGDVLLLNRQPTLHKPSIMAHTARILKGEKTLRLHYANCKAYNADFDGDEMNAHFPQNEVARSEGYNIANVSNQYLVPKDGTPLSGLIQDHMISGVRLSVRGRFFDRSDYQQLVYQALSHKIGRIILLPPAIIKPAQLWSGKQILSTVIINIVPDGKELINLMATSKISAKAWELVAPRLWKGGGAPPKNDNALSEAEVIIRKGELLAGVLDKTHYGATPYGLVHCIYELYGGSCATRLLSSFAKLFMRFLQQEGFTLGVRDILCVKQADKKRGKIIKKARKIGLDVITEALNLPRDTPMERIVEKMDESSVNNPKFRSIVDRQYKMALDSFTNDINKVCLPAGLICKFPENNLQLMVQSGAKGSTVNTMQISCLLGQIELEGKRPPVMICGKSLPSFPIFEFAPRAGGFIDGRFMTGIQPQEFFFHCMAGREGLIDTAVKTSRSGYLQRCLIKHLEGLTVGYDLTVRDSDKSVIQFLYGEDGMDISKVQFLNKKQLDFLIENTKVLNDKKLLKILKSDGDQLKLKKYNEELLEWRKKFGDSNKNRRKSPFGIFSEIVRSKKSNLTTPKIIHIWGKADDEIKNKLKEQCEHEPDPINSKFQSDHHFGSLNERLLNLVDCFQTEGKKKKQFGDVLKLKAMQSLCCPGEPVGLLAAQSIGEPSTQMTLNTFHFAGRGEMNVTLGIPRLREILMMASKNIKTPSMEVPFKQLEDLDSKAEDLRKALTKVVVGNVLEKVDVEVELVTEPARQHRYSLKFSFLPPKYYKNDFCVRPKFILRHMAKRFFAEMFAAIKKRSKIATNLVAMDEEKRAPRQTVDDDEEDLVENDKQKANNEKKINENDDESSEGDSEDDEDARTTNKYIRNHDEGEEEDKEASDLDEEDDKKNLEDIADQTGIDNTVVDSYNFAESYLYDKVKHLWCKIVFALPLNYKKLDLTAILREVAAKSVLWEVPNIKRAITYVKNDQLMLRTDGINILELFKYNEILDLNRLYCNDIHKLSEIYGIEAAAKAIIKEVQDVFDVYGIKVDPRHLSLISDYMTFNGSFEPLSRKGMENSASPLQQMSFESSLTFLKTATIRGKQDQLFNPSSCLMVGNPCQVGTGCFKLLQKISESIE